MHFLRSPSCSGIDLFDILSIRVRNSIDAAQVHCYYYPFIVLYPITGICAVSLWFVSCAPKSLNQHSFLRRNCEPPKSGFTVSDHRNQGHMANWWFLVLPKLSAFLNVIKQRNMGKKNKMISKHETRTQKTLETSHILNGNPRNRHFRSSCRMPQKSFARSVSDYQVQYLQY